MTLAITLLQDLPVLAVGGRRSNDDLPCQLLCDYISSGADDHIWLFGLRTKFVSITQLER